MAITIAYITADSHSNPRETAFVISQEGTAQTGTTKNPQIFQTILGGQD